MSKYTEEFSRNAIELMKKVGITKACKELTKLGFANVRNLAGGIDAWVGAGYPVKKGNRNK